MNDDERVILAAVAQGQLSDIIQSGVFRWKFDEPAESLLKACQVIHLRGVDISLLALASECKLSDWTPIRELWRESKNSPKVDWKPAADRIIRRSMKDIGLEVMRQTLGQLTASSDPRKILVSATTQLSGLIDNGNLYNPTPSHHYKEGVIGQVVCSTGLPSLDKQFRGGLWSQALVVMICPSNHGKSTLTYTILANCIRQGQKCVLFTFETNTATAVARVLSALTGLHTSETSLRKGSTADNQILLDQALELMDLYFSIYDNSFNDRSKIEQVIRLERPVFAGIDHISMPDPRNTGKNLNVGDESAIMAESALQWTINYSLTILANAQGSNSQQLELKKSHDIAQVTALGSSRVYNAADLFIIGLRHWSMPNTSYFRVKKDRKQGILDTDCLLHHNPLSQRYEEMA